MNRPGLLTVVSAAFVVGGIWLSIAAGSLLIGLLVVAFFGACLLVGLAGLRARRTGVASLPGWVVPASCFGFALASAVLVVSALADWGSAHPAHLGLVALTGVAGVAFFGGGGIVLLVRQLRNRQGRS